MILCYQLKMFAYKSVLWAKQKASTMGAFNISLENYFLSAFSHWTMMPCPVLSWNYLQLFRALSTIKLELFLNFSSSCPMLSWHIQCKVGISPRKIIVINEELFLWFLEFFLGSRTGYLCTRMFFWQRSSYSDRYCRSLGTSRSAFCFRLR